MTDEDHRDARKLTPEAYRSAVAELLQEARKAETDAEKARVQREVAAKYKPKDSKNA